jgi:hypothetical protein
MSLFDLLRADGSIVVNKKLARALGLPASIMYSELLSRHFYFAERGQLQDGFFFNTIADIEYATTLKDKQQRDAIKTLTAAKLLECRLLGLPAKRYFRMELNEALLVSVLNSSLAESAYQDMPTPSLAESAELDRQNEPNLEGRIGQQIILSNNTKVNKTKDTTANAVGAAPSKQRKLVSVPEATQPKAKQTRSERSLAKVIAVIESGQGWDKLTNTDFANYYVSSHNSIFLEKPISFDYYRDPGLMKVFIQTHNLPAHLVTRYLDELLIAYSKTPDRWQNLTFNMLAKNKVQLDNIMLRLHERLQPRAQKYTRGSTEAATGPAGAAQSEEWRVF